jgi:hypothetical protein
MDECYEEALIVFVLFGEPNNRSVTSEFVVSGSIKKSTKTHQSAQEHIYFLATGAFLEIKNGKITRLTTYYNIPLRN